MDAKYDLLFTASEECKILLKFHEKLTEAEMATVICYIKDSFGPKDCVTFYQNNKEVTLEEILANLGQNIDVQISGCEIPNIDHTVYINRKNQVIKISQAKNVFTSSYDTGMEKYICQLY